MKISNTNVQYLYNWLNLQLHGDQARARNKFAAIIEKQYIDSLSGRTEILIKHSEKDKKTKEPIMEKNLKGELIYKMSEKVLEKAKEEMNKFLDKVTTYELTKNEKQLVKIIVKILTDAKLPLDIATGKIYDEVMTELEKVK